MTSTTRDPKPSTNGLCCDIVAWSTCRASAADLPGLRKQPGTLGGAPVANGLLRHVDEQTVVGVVAVLKAVADSGLDSSSFERWSVLAAPRFLGRAKFEAAFPQYRDEGAWGVSPHLVPGHSLHSPSGTISQALHAHGPNLGIGGTPGGEREAFLVAVTWLDAGWSAGVWVVLTSRDPVSTGQMAVAEPGNYRALAIALTPSLADVSGPTFEISPEAIILAAADADQALRIELRDWFESPGRPIIDAGKSWRADAGHHQSLATPTHGRITRIRELI